MILPNRSLTARCFLPGSSKIHPARTRCVNYRDSLNPDVPAAVEIDAPSRTTVSGTYNRGTPLDVTVIRLVASSKVNSLHERPSQNSFRDLAAGGTMRVPSTEWAVNGLVRSVTKLSEPSIIRSIHPRKPLCWEAVDPYHIVIGRLPGRPRKR